MNLEVSNTSSINLEIGQADALNLETGLVKAPAINYMEYIDLSTDAGNPTEITDFLKSGIYVAKNTGILGIEGEPFTILAKGQFFKVTNLKEFGEIIGEEIPDDENQIQITIQSLEGPDYILTRRGLDDWEDAVDINSANINDYVNIDTSNLITRGMIGSAYGIQLIYNQLGIVPATQQEIDLGRAIYKPITAERIDYAVSTKGSKYFATKEDLQDVQDNVDKLVTDIEAVLETVVTVNE